MDILLQFATLRTDIEVLGYFQQTVPLTDAADMALMHPDGGVAYARSYKPQKLYEQMPEPKPRLVLFGHWHVGLVMPYTGAWLVCVPCTQKQTPYLRRKGLHPEIGGILMTVDVADSGKIARVRWEYLAGS